MSLSLGVMETIQEHLPEWMVEAFGLVSLLGDLLVIVPLLALLYLADVRRSLASGRSNDSLCSDRTAVLVAAVFGGLALVVLLKATFAFPRPPAELHAIDPSEYGFPSGHTMAATVFWGALAMWSSIGRQATRFVGVGVIVTLVGLSRFALGVHYLFDVIASVALGGVYLVVIAWVAQGRPERAFAVAIAIAVLAVGVSGGSTRSLLAIAGTVGGGVGWWVIG